MRSYSMATADEALEAAFEAGAITLCPKHQYNMIRTSDPALTRKAYEVGAAKITQGRFSSELSMLMKAISDMVAQGEYECHCCANIADYSARLAISRDAAKPCPCRWPTCPAHGVPSDTGHTAPQRIVHTREAAAL
jgi:hypothetical protein